MKWYTMNKDNIIPYPPTHMMFDGPQTLHEFVGNGLEYLHHYSALADLQPNERMLDVGSGIGRKTIPLTRFLTEGSYEGIDCNRTGVQWCQENITPVAPNFRFQHVDVHAPGYNPNGALQAYDIRFPFPDNEFDFVTLNSVFTHMLDRSIDNYLREVYRVLVPGGRCFITWFLVDEGVTAPPGFPHRHLNGWMANKEFPEQAIAYDSDWVMVAYADAGLGNGMGYQGTWNGRPGTAYQDIIIAKKE